MIDATKPGRAGRSGMTRSVRVLLLASVLISSVASAQSDAVVTALDTYLANLKTLRAEFSQVVTDGHGAEVQRATGKFVIQRPGRFRWELTPQTAAGKSQASQLMVADGKNLWFYDPDLEQVSVKGAANALTATPASLLAGDGKLGEFFTVRDDGSHDGLDWVRVTPNKPDADFREARFAFKRAGPELERMVLKDKLGQTVRLDFQVSTRNASVADAELKFSPPAGADVIGTPLP
jgi:outer membrane lipoprotein carrier protein